MTSKAQEIETLDKIMRMVSALGDDSYLGFTFNGVFDQAKMNIEDDAAFNYKEMYEKAYARQSELYARVTELEKQIQIIKQNNEDLREQMLSYKLDENTEKFVIDTLSDMLRSIREEKEAIVEEIRAGTIQSEDELVDKYRRIQKGHKDTEHILKVMRQIADKQ